MMRGKLKNQLAVHPHVSQRAFSLLELLVVVGLIALLVGGIGIALRDSGGTSLAIAQTSLSSMVGAARAQAAVHQTRTRLYIYGSVPPAGEPDRFLRTLQVFREEPADSGNYQPGGAAVYLPRGIYVVPPSMAGLLAPGITWPANPAPLSTFATPQPRPIQPAPTPGATFANASGYFIEFAPDGSFVPEPAPYLKLVVATAMLDGHAPRFNNPGAVRGILVRPSGAVTFVSDASAF